MKSHVERGWFCEFELVSEIQTVSVLLSGNPFEDRVSFYIDSQITQDRKMFLLDALELTHVAGYN